MGTRSRRIPGAAARIVRLSLATGLSAGLVALASAGEPRKVTSVAGISEYALDDGLEVLLFPDDSKPTVTVNLTYFVGSRHEGYGETGMAHLLEHLMFKGTPQHPQVWKALQDHGAQFNGTTSFDRTNYFETLPATLENLDFALALEADRMVNSFIAKKDLDSEFSVVRNEFEMGENDPIGILSERMMSTAYLWHNYGKSTIGSREDIERVPIERLQAFYRKFYQPDDAMLVVAGKFDEAKTLARVNELFGGIPRPTRQLEATYTVEPAQDGEREVVLRRAGGVQAIGCIYHICSGSHEDIAPLEVLASTLTANQTGRLYKALIEPKLATTVRASAESLHDPGVLEIMVEARTDQSLDAIRKALIDVLDNLGKQTFTDEEVNRAKAAAARNFDLMLNDSGRVGLRLTESAATGDWRLMFLDRDRMAKVTPADVQRVAAAYLKPSNRTVGIFVPDKQPDRATIPPSPSVAELFKGFKDTQPVARGAAFEATFANIEARTQRSNLPVGMKLALLPKETRGNRVNASLAFHYGSEADLKGRNEAASFVAPMLMRGTTRHTRRQIEDRLAELKAQVSVGAFGGGRRRGRPAPGGRDEGTLDVTIETTRENLPAVLELVGEILRQPAFPGDEFDTLKAETLEAFEQQISEPTFLASIELQRRLRPYPPDDVRYVPSPAEQLARIKAVNLDDVKGIYTGLLGASASCATFVGDFDPAEVRAALDKHLGDWKSPKPFQRIAASYRPAKPDAMVISTPDKANAMFGIGVPIEMRDDDPDFPALFMANFILGGSPSSRMMNRIRQKEGLSYGCGSSLAVSPLDRSGVFTGFGICAPQNAERALAAAREELEKLIRDGVSQQELDDARKGYHQAVEVTLANDSAVAGMWTRDLFADRTMKFSEAQLAKIDALGVKDVQAAIAKYVKPEMLVAIRAGDFAPRQGTPPPAGGEGSR